MRKVYKFELKPIEGKFFDTEVDSVFDGVNQIDWMVRCEFTPPDLGSSIKTIMTIPVCRIKSTVEREFETIYKVDVKIKVANAVKINQDFTLFVYDKEDKLYVPPRESIRWEAAYNTYYQMNLYKMDHIFVEVAIEEHPKSIMQMSMEKTLQIYKNIYESGDGSDVTIRLPDGDLTAHKFILVAHSPVFERMFSTEMLEKKTNIVTVNDIDLETMDALLRFIYYHDIVGIEENPTRAFIAADKYQIDNAMDICRKIEIREDFVK